MSFVRQLEAQLHIDGTPQTVSDLQRFVKQLVLVAPSNAAAALPEAAAAPLAAGNVQHAPTLAAVMGLPEA
jgi:hypothetical protein